ncbi:hypothetical protein GM182_07250 [bacterium 3DAC]|nr:hypothetical protein GM182_07250 [bacterium 3DAC]
MRRWGYFIVLFLILSVVFMSIPLAWSRENPYTISTVVTDICGLRNISDVAKLGDATYLINGKDILYYCQKGRLQKTYKLGDGYSPVRVIPINDKYLWLITTRSRFTSGTIVNALLLDAKDLHVYDEQSIYMSAVVVDVDVIAKGRMVSMSPVRYDTDRIVVALLHTLDKSDIVQLHANLNTGKIEWEVDKEDNIWAIASPSELTNEVYGIIKSGDKWYLAKTTMGSLVFSGNKTELPFSELDSALIDVKDGKAYIIGVNGTDPKKTRKILYLVVDVGAGKILYNVASTLWGPIKLLDIKAFDDRSAAIFKVDSDTYVAIWQEGRSDLLVSDDTNNAYRIDGYTTVIDNGYSVKGGFFLPLNNERYTGMVWQVFDYMPDAKVSLVDKDKYQKSADGCIYTLTGHLSFTVLDNLYARVRIMPKKTGPEGQYVYLTQSGEHIPLFYDLKEHGVSRLYAETSAELIGYYSLLRDNAYENGASFVSTKDIDTCFHYVELKKPMISVKQDGKDIWVGVTTYNDTHGVLKIYMTKPDGSTSEVYTENIKGKGFYTAKVTPQSTGTYAFVAKETIVSGPDSTILRSGTEKIGIKNSPTEAYFPNISWKDRDFSRQYVFGVYADKAGTLYVKEGTSDYKFAVEVGSNSFTIPLNERGKHSVQMKYCVSSVCSDWKTYEVELYDYIEMWIGKRAYKLNGESKTMDAAPFIDPVASRTVVPLRFILEGLSFQVKWDGKARTITVDGSVSSDKRSVVISMPIAKPTKRGRYTVYMGSPKVVVKDSGGTHTIDMRNYKGQDMGIPFIYENRTYVPVRFISEIFEGKVGWDGAERKVTIER